MRQVLLVGLKDTIRTHNARILWVTVQRETVGDLSCVERHSTESKGRENLVEVIRFENRADLLNGFEVLVVWTHVMERVTVLRITIRSCEVNSDSQVDRPTATKVLRETWHLIQLEILKFDLASTSTKALLNVIIAFFDQTIRSRNNVTNFNAATHQSEFDSNRCITI